MTEKQKPTRWERDEGDGDIYLWSKPGDADLVVISGPDREANARLFLRARELVEALKRGKEHFALISAGCLRSETDRRELQLLAIGAANEIDAILAKIEGVKK